MLAAEIRMHDVKGMLAVLSLGKTDFNRRDRAGYDILAYACALVWRGEGEPEPVRVLLEAGANPNRSRTPDGEDLLNYMIAGPNPKSQEVARILADHGADPNRFSKIHPDGPA